MSSLPLVIINPASAGGATGGAWPETAAELRRHFGPFACVYTESAGDARRIAAREANAGREFIIACGGDGTISEVADGILLSGASSELGVLPSGTGGDFRRTLEMPRRTRQAALTLREGQTRLIDAGRVTFINDDGREETRHFVNVASIGMGGDVIRRVKGNNSLLPAGASRALGGRVAFAAAVVQSAFTYQKPPVRFRLDDGPEFRLVVANFCVANARFFGGGMKVAPEAKLDDGLFDVVAIGDLNAAEILLNSYRVYLGTHLGMQKVQHTRARKVIAEAFGESPVAIEIDGELAGRLPATFEIVPRAINVRCPR